MIHNSIHDLFMNCAQSMQCYCYVHHTNHANMLSSIVLYWICTGFFGEIKQVCAGYLLLTMIKGNFNYILGPKDNHRKLNIVSQIWKQKKAFSFLKEWGNPLKAEMVNEIYCSPDDSIGGAGTELKEISSSPNNNWGKQVFIKACPVWTFE